MKSKEEASSPDYDNISDAAVNEDEEGKPGSKQRSRGKRRTAREIANMFEQLKQRHITRKREWQEEKEELLKRLQMADESKKVLVELKGMLQNLREELRMEERKRKQMELEHFNEKSRWDAERESLLKKIEESAHESDRDGKDLRKMSEKIVEQTKQITELEGMTIDLKRQLLEKEKQHLREKREMQFYMDKEKASMKKKEHYFNVKLQQLGVTQSSASSISSPQTDAPDPMRDFIQREDTPPGDVKRTTRSSQDITRYNDFQKKVDDALKQIEKISTDLDDIDKQRKGSEPHAVTASDYVPTSPSPMSDAINHSSSASAPWRTKRRVSTLSQSAVPGDIKSSVSSTSFQSASSVDASISLPSINNAQKLSPNPERKIKKIKGQGNQVDIIVSSPDTSQSSQTYQDIRLSDRGDQNNENKLEFSTTNSNDSNLRNKPNRRSSTGKKPLFRHHTIDAEFDEEKYQTLNRNKNATSPAHETDALAQSMRDHESPQARSSSPRLPKLHQQLLFKREPSLPLDKNFKKSFDSEYGPTHGSAYTERLSLSSPKEQDQKNTHTPYFDPHLGYIKTKPSSSKESDSSNQFINKAESKISDQERTHASIVVSPNLKTGNTKDEAAAPVVQPKPKVSIHKDNDGNIIRVSPTISGKSHSPENYQVSEKQYSIAERVGKAGRDWIRKKLNFKDKAQESHETGELGRGLPAKRKGKGKSRNRSSSLLRNKHESRSVSTSDESSESESRRRESFLRRNKRKGKSNANPSPGSPAKTKPKKYSRSKTDASTKDMRNFLSKFKASQGNPNKPSVVKQFEKKLLENEVKTLSEDKEDEESRSQLPSTGKPSNPSDSQFQQGDSMISVVDGGSKRETSSPIYAKVRKHRPLHPDENRDGVKIRNKYKPTTNTNTQHRKSMTDFDPLAADNNQQYNNSIREVEHSLASGSSASSEARKMCEKTSVSKLVNRFSSNFEEETPTDLSGTKRSTDLQPVLKTSLRKASDGGLSRSHSLTSQDCSQRRTRFSEGMGVQNYPRQEMHKSSEDRRRTEGQTGLTWHDRITAISEVDAAETSEQAEKDGSLKAGKVESLSSFWEDRRDYEKDDTTALTKPGRAKVLSAEMKQKTDMLEKALAKGPRRPRRYRRADTQPVVLTKSTSDDESLTDDNYANFYQRPISMDVNQANNASGFPINIDAMETERMHETIPPVTVKFNKPNKPGRLPSRWAR